MTRKNLGRQIRDSSRESIRLSTIPDYCHELVMEIIGRPIPAVIIGTIELILLRQERFLKEQLTPTAPDGRR